MSITKKEYWKEVKVYCRSVYGLKRAGFLMKGRIMRNNKAILFIVSVFFAILTAKTNAADNSNKIPTTPDSKMTEKEDWYSFSANLDLSHRKTSFYKSNHNTLFGQLDSRLEFWLPPGRNTFTWGPYVRLAGMESNRSYAWENAWLAKPGYGFQIYPFSGSELKNTFAGNVFGPLRVFGEYNRQDYWGSENTWRPDEQTRAGLEYWKEINANNTSKQWWSEIWAGYFWQSANEFDKDYDTPIFAYAVRLGVREPDADIISNFTPYLILESSLTDNVTYYWENRLLGGAGVRFAPLVIKKPGFAITRFVIYAEYLDVMDYYHDSSPSSVPDHDFRVGISLNIGDWYK
jgi:hypothetical protein